MKNVCKASIFHSIFWALLLGLSLSFVSVAFSPAMAQEQVAEAFEQTQQPAQNTQDSLFVVRGVRTDVTADNAVQAREKALQRARMNAFEIVSERLLSGDEKHQSDIPDDITISSMVDNFEVVDERLSSVRYVATVNVFFNEQALKDYFFQENESYAPVARQKTLILPWFSNAGQKTLWGDINPWMDAWHKLPQQQQHVPYALPLGDIMDMRDFAAFSPLQYDPNAMRQLERRYGAASTVITVAEPQGAALAITLYEVSFTGTTPKGRFVVQPETSDIEQLYIEAAQQVLQRLNQSWKRQTAIRPEVHSQTYNAVAVYSGLRDWLDIKSALETMDGVQDLKVASVTPQRADLKFRFSGNINAMAMLMDQYHLTLSQRPVTIEVPTGRQFQNAQFPGFYGQRQPVRTKTIMQYEIRKRPDRGY